VDARLCCATLGVEIGDLADAGRAAKRLRHLPAIRRCFSCKARQFRDRINSGYHYRLRIVRLAERSRLQPDKDCMSDLSPTLALARELIARQSVTPEDKGCLDLIAERLIPLGFAIERIDIG